MHISRVSPNDVIKPQYKTWLALCKFLKRLDTTTLPWNENLETPQLKMTHEEYITCLWRGCGKTLLDCTDLYSHLLEEHVCTVRDTERCACKCGWINCDYRGQKKIQLKSHIHVHVPYRPFQCSICQKTFKRKFDLKKHINGLHFRNIDEKLVYK